MNELKKDLGQFIGTEKYHKLTLFGKLVGTDGVAYLVQKVGAFWLVDAIASYQGKKLDDKCGGIQFWTLEVKDKQAVLTCNSDEGEPTLVKQEISYTDFPEGTWKFYVQDGGDVRVLMLPSEY